MRGKRPVLPLNFRKLVFMYEEKQPNACFFNQILVLVEWCAVVFLVCFIVFAVLLCLLVGGWLLVVGWLRLLNPLFYSWKIGCKNGGANANDRAQLSKQNIWSWHDTPVRMSFFIPLAAKTSIWIDQYRISARWLS